MYFDFLFQNYEGVLSLTKRKAKVLTILSLSGLVIAIVCTIVFALNIETSKNIPGTIVLGCMAVLCIIFLLQGSYKAAVRVILLLPLSAYFFYINSNYSFAIDDQALLGIVKMLIGGYFFLMIFSFSYTMFGLFFIASVILVVYYFLNVENIEALFTFSNPSLLGLGNPLVDVALVGGFCLLVYLFYTRQLDASILEHKLLRTKSNETIRQAEFGIMVLKIQRDKYGEKSGMVIEKINPVFAKSFNAVKEELIGVDFSEAFPKIFRDSFNWQEVFYYSNQSNLLVHFDHLDQWFNIYNTFPEKDLIVSTFFNVSPFKQETSRLKLREKRLTSLMGSLPDIFFIIERDGTYIDYVSNNPELMRLSQKDIIGKTIFEMGFSKSMSYQIYTSIQHVLENDNIETIEYGMELSSGKTLIFEMRLARLNENQIISIGRDVTSKKEYEHKLLEAKQKLEEASRLKASFIENISHEMRTPMNAIIGFSGLAMNERFNLTEKNEFLGIVIENGENLMDIVTNLIDISEIETGTLTVKMQACLVNELFDNINNKFIKYLKKQKSKVQLEMHLDEVFQKFEIFTDAHLLDKIIGHLISNAIKFTKDGKVVFGYKIKGEHIQVYVYDTGIGIEEKDAEMIYNQFHQSDNVVARKYGGTGIGLTIVKNLVELLGGEISFESKPREGSKFFFELPVNNYLRIVRD